MATKPIPAQAAAKRIALLGAEGTGKTTLANALAAHLRECGLAAAAVPETLHAWCERAGRAPRPEEWLAIAEEHERRVEAAAAQAEFVVADTTALMVAIHAGLLLPDGALHRFAIERQRRYDATLVTGLDLPWRPGGLQREPGSREAVDALAREHLRRSGVAFQVVYGDGAARLRGAVQALATAGVLPASVREREEAQDAGAAGWVWLCEKCSDPACEHRLFRQLQEARR